jgi:hypothetical protein
MPSSKLPTKYDLRNDENSPPSYTQPSLGSHAFLITGDGHVSSQPSSSLYPFAPDMKARSRISPRRSMSTLMSRIQTTAEDNVAKAVAECKVLTRFFKDAPIKTSFSDLDSAAPGAGFGYMCPDAVSSEETIRPSESTLRASPKKPVQPTRIGDMFDDDACAEFGMMSWGKRGGYAHSAADPFVTDTTENRSSVLRVANPDVYDDDEDSDSDEDSDEEEYHDPHALRRIPSRGSIESEQLRTVDDDNRSNEGNHVFERPPSRHSFLDGEDEDEDEEGDHVAEKALLNLYNRMLGLDEDEDEDE